jgi:DNA-binding NarL/FixJ family response regulator
MADKILFVDDEPLVLDGYKRMLRGKFEVDTAIGGDKGLDAIQINGPYGVVISDMRMPGMNGAEFLALVRQKAPETVRMLLTGYTDLDAAIDAVNEGNIFRYLSKPCEQEMLVKAINLGLAQYRSVTSEKMLLKKAQVIEKANSDWDTKDSREWDICEDPTGLPGPAEAKEYLAALIGVDPQCHVAMFKITMLQTIEERYGELAVAEYLNFAAHYLVQGLRGEDRLFHWSRDVLMGVLRRRISPVALRMEITRLASSIREHVHMMEVKGKNIVTTCPVAFDLLPVSQFSTFDDMLMTFEVRSTQNHSISLI